MPLIFRMMHRSHCSIKFPFNCLSTFVDLKLITNSIIVHIHRLSQSTWHSYTVDSSEFGGNIDSNSRRCICNILCINNRASSCRMSLHRFHYQRQFVWCLIETTQHNNLHSRHLLQVKTFKRNYWLDSFSRILTKYCGNYCEATKFSEKSRSKEKSNCNSDNKAKQSD